jgi:DNA-binding MarR family transcriptional regulator
MDKSNSHRIEGKIGSLLRPAEETTPVSTVARKRRSAKSRPTPEPTASLTGRRRLPLLLRKAWFGLNQTFRRFSAKSGITPDQFTVLRTLIEHEPSQLTQSELAAKMTSDPNTITSLLKRMEASGLIQRRADTEDRRARRIILNAAGRQTYEHAAPMALELQARVLMSLPEDRRELFLQELEIIANSCQNALKRWQ